jgi:exosome complex component MTR3
VEAALEAAVLLDTFPKAVLDVYCFVLEAGGGELGVACTAASLAIAEAGVGMRDLVAACHVVSGERGRRPGTFLCTFDVRKWSGGG